MLSLNEIPIILDLGANTGLSAIFFAKQFPEATVIAVEPEAENYKLLEKNCLGYTNIETVHAAISEEAGRRVSLMRPGSGEWSWQTREDDLGPIPTTSINELLSRIADGRLLIVKIDIEGSETELFQSNTDWVPKAALVIFEPHDWLFNWRGTADAVFSSLTRTPRDYRFKGENIFAFSHDLIKPRPTKYPTNETEAPAPEVKK